MHGMADLGQLPLEQVRGCWLGLCGEGLVSMRLSASAGILSEVMRAQVNVRLVPGFAGRIRCFVLHVSKSASQGC